MKRATRLVMALLLVVCAAGNALAVNTTLTLYPNDPRIDPNPASGAAGQYPASEWGSGSWQANGINKSQVYLSPLSVFGSSNVTLGDISSISYFTNKATTHVASAPDWYFQVYTESFLNNSGRWYGFRVTSEPYFAKNLTETVGTWTEWQTGDASTTNAMRYFDSSHGYFGSYTDPLWDAYLATNAYDDAQNLLGIMADQKILSVTMGTGSGWAAGFTGKLDGLSFVMDNGDIHKVNFEASAPVATPEPGTMLLMGIGVAGAALLSRRMRKTGVLN